MINKDLPISKVRYNDIQISIKDVELEAENLSLQNELSSTQSQLNTAETNLADTIIERDSLQTQLDNTISELEIANNRIAELENSSSGNTILPIGITDINSVLVHYNVQLEDLDDSGNVGQEISLSFQKINTFDFISNTDHRESIRNQLNSIDLNNNIVYFAQETNKPTFNFPKHGKKYWMNMYERFQLNVSYDSNYYTTSEAPLYETINFPEITNENAYSSYNGSTLSQYLDIGLETLIMDTNHNFNDITYYYFYNKTTNILYFFVFCNHYPERCGSILEPELPFGPDFDEIL